VSKSNGAVRLSWSGHGGVVADDDLVFYVDECGNTGARHTDDFQPFYVTAGWLLRKVDVERACSVVARCAADTGMLELKGSRMLKTTRGTRAAFHLIRELLAFCTPIFVIIEKRYALCVRIFEHFLTHPASGFFADKRSEKAIAQQHLAALSELPKAVLVQADEYMQHPSPEKAAQYVCGLKSALIDAGHVELAAAADRAPFAPAWWWKLDEVRARSLSPNVLGFTTLLQALELLGIESNRNIALVHDELRQFQHVYAFYQDFASRMEVSHAQAIFERSGAPGRVVHVQPPRFAQSNSEPLIQSADVICGAASSLLRHMQRPQETLLPERRDLAILLLWGFVEPDLRRYFLFIGSGASGFAFGQRLVDVFPQK